MLAVIVDRFHRNPMRKQCASGVELLAVDHVIIAIGGDPRFQFQGVFGAALRTGVADAPAFQNALE
ncbi:hypothetical protein D3C78_1692340 [compost metagenome]